MFNLLFGGKPNWIDSVQANGQAAKATLLHEPQEILKGKSYEGEDRWIDARVRVEPGSQPAYEAAAKCTLSQAVFGLMQVGTVVNVRVDARDPKRVVIVDDVQTLQSYRLKNP